MAGYLIVGGTGWVSPEAVEAAINSGTGPCVIVKGGDVSSREPTKAEAMAAVGAMLGLGLANATPRYRRWMGERTAALFQHAGMSHPAYVPRVEDKPMSKRRRRRLRGKAKH